MKHLRELPPSRTGGTGRVSCPWADLTPPWQVRLWLSNCGCPGSNKKRAKLSPVTFFEIIFNRLLHPRSCLLSFPLLILGTKKPCWESEAVCSQLQHACTFLRGASGETLHLSSGMRPLLSSPPGTFPQPALTPSSVVVSSPFIYGVKSFLNLGGFFFLAVSPKVNTSISV